MIFPYLFTMGLCALSHVAKLHALQLTELLPTEERVQIMHLSNGVKVYVQEHDAPAHCGSFRVVFRKTFSEEELYRYDVGIESWDSIEQFFLYCKEKASIGSIEDLTATSSDLPNLGSLRPQEIAVVAVGDFSLKEMKSLIEKHFGSLHLAYKPDTEGSIRIGIDPKTPKVVLNFSYPTLTQSIQTYLDLKEAWKVLLLQDLFQQRLEHCSRNLEQAWIHPHSRFFYPVKGYSLVSHEDCENLLAFFLWQVEAIRNNGFYEDEFYIVKRKLLNRLQYLASRSVSPDNAFLASYFADQFLMGERCISLQPFMNGSAQLIEEIKIQDLFLHIEAFLCEKKRSIRLSYPISTHAEFLTKDCIEQMIKRIASLASFYRDSKLAEDEVWTLKTRWATPLSACSIGALENVPSLEGFKLAENFIIPINGSVDTIDSFYQLPITEKQKRLIHSIITAMAEKNILQLAFIKRSMEKKGKKIEYVHPLRFMGYILSSSELRSCLRTIKKSSFKWDAFIDGFSRRMREEYANNNLCIHIPGFCQQIGGDQELVTRFIHKKDWEGLIEEHL